MKLADWRGGLISVIASEGSGAYGREINYMNIAMKLNMRKNMLPMVEENAVKAAVYRMLVNARLCNQYVANENSRVIIAREFS
ncbi:MAG: hypothetical protein VR67_17380 [Peptococcaceae bacterium BRH_c8a]|nr:MAG: hypothetical protein VR67_17380 [Peptococcaceae bacterium BRH_c8a]